MESLIQLPYAQDALEPAISAKTIGFHHGKHLAGYVANLNKAIAGTEMENAPLEEIVKSAEPGTGVFNNAGQILNHNLYFSQFRSLGSQEESHPSRLLAAAIDRDFGSFDTFKAAFIAAGISIFGSGWVWLQADAENVLYIGKYSGADNPVVHGLKPLLTFDVWEHAYYLDYQNRRADHLAALWEIVDWMVVEERYAELLCTDLSEERLSSLLDEMAAELRPEMQEHTALWKMPESVKSWESNIQDMHSYISKRYDVISSQIKRQFSLSDGEWKALLNKYK